MRNFLISLATALLLAANLQAQGKWEIDASHSNIQFNVTHLVVSEVNGSFRKFSGSASTDKADFDGAKIEFSADVNSIFTDNENRDKHLMGDDFFNAEKFPKLTFVGKSFKKIGDKKYELVGDLTIRDVTKTVTLQATYGGTITDPWKNTKAGFKLSGTINRKDFGLKWNALMEGGGAVVGDEVELVCKIELLKK